MQEVVGSSPISSTLKSTPPSWAACFFDIHFVLFSQRSAFKRRGVGQSGFHEETVDLFDFLGHGITGIKVVVGRLAVRTNDGHVRDATHAEIGIEDVFLREGDRPSDVHGFDILGHLGKLFFIAGTLHLPAFISEVHRLEGW